MVQGLDSLSLKIQELTQPSSIPGKNSHNLERVQFSSIKSEPTIMLPKQSPQMLSFCPRVTSQNIAKISPPEPFQPTQRLMSSPANPTRHDTLSLLSRGVQGRYGYSSNLRMIPIQLMRKAVRVVTKAYCSMGMPKMVAMRVCSTISRGPTITNMKLDNRISGSWLWTLQEYSSETSIGGAAGVSIDLSSSERKLSFRLDLLIDNITISQTTTSKL